MTFGEQNPNRRALSPFMPYRQNPQRSNMPNTINRGLPSSPISMTRPNAPQRLPVGNILGSPTSSGNTGFPGPNSISGNTGVSGPSPMGGQVPLRPPMGFPIAPSLPPNMDIRSGNTGFGGGLLNPINMNAKIVNPGTFGNMNINPVAFPGMGESPINPTDPAMMEILKQKMGGNTGFAGGRMY